MIVFLKGTLIEKSPAAAIVDVHGVGYEILISLSTYDRLPATGSACKILTHHHIREDIQQLFGFATADEKNMFLRLINVNGIGPKTALTILSGLTASELMNAIANNDVKRISAVHGIGKKTAERLIVELKDKVDPLEAIALQTAGGGSVQGAILRDTVLALVSLGFPQDQAKKMAQSALDASPEAKDPETLLRKALSSK